MKHKPLAADAAPRNRDATLDRRRFLKYVGAGTGALYGAGSIAALAQLGCRTAGPDAVDSLAWVLENGTPNWKAPAYPVPLPGDEEPAAQDKVRLATYDVIDDLVVPEGFRYDIVAQWGDRFGAPGHEVQVGYNCDYTGMVPIEGSDDEFWLFVNHEYVSGRPWLEAYEAQYGEAPPDLKMLEDPEEDPEKRSRRGLFSIDGWQMPKGYLVDLDKDDIPEEVQQKIGKLSTRIMSEVGVSVLRVRRLENGVITVVRDATDHRRISAFDSTNVAEDVAASWRFTGPAASLLPSRPSGTMSNCSGGTTPWGTFLTCEENFYSDVHEDIGPDGQPIPENRPYFGARGNRVNGEYVFPHPLPPTIFGNGMGLGFAGGPEARLDGRGYGWVTEIDPTSGSMKKHTGLGRFRHENVAIRCEAGKPVAAYMGDDRRGGHLWKFVSDGKVTDPTSPENSKLLESGTLYAARFEPDFTGRWIPLEVDTPLRAPEPQEGYSAHVQVPSRIRDEDGLGGTVDVGDTQLEDADATLELEDWIASIESFTGKPFAECTLGDLVTPTEGAADEAARGILVMDAFAMANACGGTPSARPEDIEVHPRDQTVYIAFTDATDGSDGAPDGRIFPDSKRENSRQYGAIYRLIEGGVESPDSDPAATTFTWGKFVSSGEAAESGGGFACADNMAFDQATNLWMMTDISTTSLNFPTSRKEEDGSHPGGSTFRGIFGNNALFMIPTRGPEERVPRLFALAPMEAEFCGPTFTEDDKTLILSVQHPGEVMGAQTNDPQAQEHLVFDRSNQEFVQQRTVPRGSNFPHGRRGEAPRPCVVCVTREAEG